MLATHVNSINTAMKKLDRTGWEILLLITLILTLPLVEAPKNIFWFIFVVTWFVNRKHSGNWGGKWDGWDNLIAAWIGVYTLGTFFAGIPAGEWVGLEDPLQYISVLWLIKRSQYEPHQIMQLVVAITAATLIALPTAYWATYVTHAKTYIELHSVGHSNHTAIYIVINFGLLLAFTQAFWRDWNTRHKSLAIAALSVFLLSIILSQSRAAVGVSFLLVIMLAIAWWPRSKASAGSLATGLIVIVIAVIVIAPPVLKEQKNYEAHNNILSNRDKIWNVGILGWREFPLFGIGARNYKLLDDEKIELLAKKHDGKYTAEDYFPNSHAHNRYINTLTERGIAGLGILLIVMLAFVWQLLKQRPRREDSNLYWGLWGGTLAAWFTHITIGAVNTTLHHEHALLTMIITGLYLQYTQTNKKGTMNKST